MTTDNRTSEPNQNETKSGQEFCFSEAQVEAAAKAIADCHNPGMFERYPENWRVEARAALVAAQGAAPQTNVLKDAVDALRQNASEIREAHLAVHGMVDPITNAVAAGIEQGAAIVDEMGGCQVHAPAPVLPSSTVDEDKLAEVLREAEQSWHLSDEKSQQSYACGAPDLKSKYIARAVGEWFKEQGR